MTHYEVDDHRAYVDDYARCTCGHYACNHVEDPPFEAACMEFGCECENFEERFPEVDRDRE